MNELPRQKLCEIVALYGEAVSEDPRRCEALLRDLCGQHRKEIFLLVNAIHDGVPGQLRSSRGGIPPAVLVGRLTTRLCDNFGLAPSAATWAVESWALALGMLSVAELEARKESRATDSRTQEIPSAPKSDLALPDFAHRVTVAQRGGGDYTTIAEAMKHAAGDTCIMLRPGVYKERLRIDKPIAIVGDGPLHEITIDGSTGRSSEPTILLQAPSLVLRGVTVYHGDGDSIQVREGCLTADGCSIVSRICNGLEVSGPSSVAVTSNCKVQGGGDISSAYAAIRFAASSRGEITNCQVQADWKPAVVVVEGSDVHARRSRLHSANNSGLIFRQSSRGSAEDCEIVSAGEFHNNKAALVVLQWSDPRIKGCRLQSSAGGLYLDENAAGTFEDCEITSTGQFPAVAVGLMCNPVLLRCKLHAPAGNGIVFFQNSQGTADDCVIIRSAQPGVVIRQGSNPLVTKCKVREGVSHGIHVCENSQGTIEECEIVGNAGIGVAIAGAAPTIRRCQINGNGQQGVWVGPGGSGSVEGCDLTGNAGGAWSIVPGATIRQSGNRQ